MLAGLMLLPIANVFAQEWLIDVRTPAEFSEGSAAGAVNIEFQNIVEGVQTLGVEKNDTVRVYCRSGNRSEKARQSLLKAGYSNVENLGSLGDAKKWQAKQTVKHAH
ncbi:Phage shock protein [gamma proteobacterium HdN1]|nr:Phage shock protein [gamma proteobacterium HdN1]